MLVRGWWGGGELKKEGLPRKKRKKRSYLYLPATDYHKHYVMAPSESSKQSKSEDQTF
jgi:hypothetical protein